jgi:hypothetical protein
VTSLIAFAAVATSHFLSNLVGSLSRQKIGGLILKERGWAKLAPTKVRFYLWVCCRIFLMDVYGYQMDGCIQMTLGWNHDLCLWKHGFLRALELELQDGDGGQGEFITQVSRATYIFNFSRVDHIISNFCID